MCLLWAQHVPLNLDPIQAQARNGSNRASNFTLACLTCKQKKAARDIREFLAHETKKLAHILEQANRPLNDAAAVNSTRWALVAALRANELAVETGSGSRTKWNRYRLVIPKTHALDAACVGAVASLIGWTRPTLPIKSTGRGSYQRTRLDAFGFPHDDLMKAKSVKGFQTGDQDIATVPAGKKAGVHRGRVAIRKTGSL